MKVEQFLFTPAHGWKHRSGSLAGAAPQFVLVFGERFLLGPAILADVRARFPGARLVIASTGGEISGTDVLDGSICATAVALERSRVIFAATPIPTGAQSRECGVAVGRQLRCADLAHVFVLCDGSQTNGTEFVSGLTAELPTHVKITGGLAGDSDRFERTLVGLDDLTDTPTIVALGFCGEAIEVEHGCEGGWSPFGPERIVTRSQGNQLFELDGRSALSLYKTYLGEKARELPRAAFHFPLSIEPPGGGFPLVRTILSIDEANESMTFAGDIPQGAKVRLMRATQEDLVDGAGKSVASIKQRDPSLVICVSCLGRKIVLGQRAEEETEMVRDSLDGEPVITGFYSYGELAPSDAGGNCHLHNQTMTLTVLRER